VLFPSRHPRRLDGRLDFGRILDTHYRDAGVSPAFLSGKWSGALQGSSVYHPGRDIRFSPVPLTRLTRRSEIFASISVLTSRSKMGRRTIPMEGSHQGAVTLLHLLREIFLGRTCDHGTGPDL
jgi:hypothetical protein